MGYTQHPSEPIKPNQTTKSNLMKKSFLLITLMVGIFYVSAFSQKKGIITVKTSFIGIVEGYDHVNKTQLFIDGNLAGESAEQPESKPISFSVQVPRGTHTVKVLNLAFYEGNWEEHTIANNYSLDASHESIMTIKKKKTISLVFDIDKTSTDVKIK